MLEAAHYKAFLPLHQNVRSQHQPPPWTNTQGVDNSLDSQVQPARPHFPGSLVASSHCLGGHPDIRSWPMAFRLAASWNLQLSLKMLVFSSCMSCGRRYYKATTLDDVSSHTSSQHTSVSAFGSRSVPHAVDELQHPRSSQRPVALLDRARLGSMVETGRTVLDIALGKERVGHDTVSA